MKNLEVLLLALPSAVMFCLTMYMKNIHEGEADERAVTRGWTYGVLAAGFFVFVFIVKFVVVGHSA